LEENFPSRTKNTRTSRLEKSNSRKNNKEYVTTITINPEGKLDSQKGVEYCQINTFMKNNFVEYQLFDDDKTYFQNKNIPENGDIGIGANLPSFSKGLKKLQ
jgi:hypothetical protein